MKQTLVVPRVDSVQGRNHGGRLLMSMTVTVTVVVAVWDSVSVEPKGVS